jgi:reactive intermediate/imine deaminase
MRSLVLIAGIVAVPAVLAAQERTVIRPPGSMTGLPFSPAIRAGNTIYLSGQIGIPPGGQALVPGGIGPETRQTLENLRRVLEAAGSSMTRVVKCTVFLADMADYAAMNQVYASFFPADPPARSTLAASGLAFNARVEIECIALAGA